MLLTGTLLAVVDRHREWEGERWTERTLHLLGDDFHTTEVTLSRAGANSYAFDESRLPEPHQPVALSVYAKAGAQKRVYWTATAVASEDDLMSALGLLPAGK